MNDPDEITEAATGPVADMRTAVDGRLRQRVADAEQSRRRTSQLRELFARRRTAGLAARHRNKLSRTQPTERKTTMTITHDCNETPTRPPAHLYQRTAIGAIPTPPGWTLHFPDTETGECDVVPVDGWTVYDNGDAAPYTVNRRGPACVIHDANQGNCYAVAPQTGHTERLEEARALCSEILGHVQAGQTDPNLYRMVGELLHVIEGTAGSTPKEIT